MGGGLGIVSNPRASAATARRAPVATAPICEGQVESLACYVNGGCHASHPASSDLRFAACQDPPRRPVVDVVVRAGLGSVEEVNLAVGLRNATGRLVYRQALPTGPVSC